MEITAVYVEQVIIGFAFLMTAAVMVTGRLPQPDEKGLVAGAVVVGASYVAGIFWDRCADTLLERLEKWSRISFAVRGMTSIDGDPFPEYSKKQKRGDDAPYLQSRYRIMRSIAALLPAMTIATVIYQAELPREIRAMFVAATALIYLLLPLTSLLFDKVPQTNETDQLAPLVERRRKKREATYKLPPFAETYEPAMIVLALLSVEALEIALLGPDRWLMSGVALAGTALTLLAGWAWLRINRTYLVFLRDQSDKT